MTGRAARPWIVPAALLLPLALAGCGALSHGFLNAQGPVAAHERELFLVVAAVLFFVAAPVLLLVPLFAWHYRLANTRHAYRPKWEFSWPVEALIWLPPLAIVIGLAVLLWRWTEVDDPYRPLPGGPPVEVEAIALDWKWVFLYPGQGIASVDRLAIPAGRPVHLRLTSGTVMQSMLMPQLAGQIYAMAGMTTELNVAAFRPGRFLGKNAQFNGRGFQAQRFDVVSLPAADFARWGRGVAAGRATLDAAEWRRLARPSVVGRPIFYARVAPRLFDRVVAANGGLAHAHPEPRR